MKTLFFHTNNLEESTNGEHEQYTEYVYNWAKKHGFDVEETSGQFGYDENVLYDMVQSGDATDEDVSDLTEGLWEKYCAGDNE